MFIYMSQWCFCLHGDRKFLKYIYYMCNLRNITVTHGKLYLGRDIYRVQLYQIQLMNQIISEMLFYRNIFLLIAIILTVSTL